MNGRCSWHHFCLLSLCASGLGFLCYKWFWFGTRKHQIPKTLLRDNPQTPKSWNLTRTELGSNNKINGTENKSSSSKYHLTHQFCEWDYSHICPLQHCARRAVTLAKQHLECLQEKAMVLLDYLLWVFDSSCILHSVANLLAPITESWCSTLMPINEIQLPTVSYSTHVTYSFWGHLGLLCGADVFFWR